MNRLTSVGSLLVIHMVLLTVASREFYGDGPPIDIWKLRKGYQLENNLDTVADEAPKEQGRAEGEGNQLLYLLFNELVKKKERPSDQLENEVDTDHSVYRSYGKRMFRRLINTKKSRGLVEGLCYLKLCSFGPPPGL